MALCTDNSGDPFPEDHSQLSSTDLTEPSYSLKHIGLDLLHRTFFKLFIRDVSTLNESAFKEVDSGVFTFHGHVVLKVEIMGILVRVDLKDIRHAYVVDDGTSTITCNLWRIGKQRPSQKISGLPRSLVKKQDEMLSSYTPLTEGFRLGDLVCIRGRVTFYAGRKEIDVLDIFKFDNPNCELERVLELPYLYSECYSKPFVPLNQRTAVSSPSELFMNPDVWKFHIMKHIEENEATINTFTINDVLSWTSFKSLRNISGDGLSQHHNLILESALESISECHGLICRRYDGVSGNYEMVKEGCGLCQEMLRILQMFHHKQILENSFHIKQINAALKKSSHYARAAPMAVQKALQVLENTSDIIRVDSNRYMPLVV